MPTDLYRITAYLDELVQRGGLEQLRRQLQPHTGAVPPRVPGGSRITPEAVQKRWKILKMPSELQEVLGGDTTASSWSDITETSKTLSVR